MQSHRYHLLNQVGEGTYGSVWKAVNKLTNELVAVKIFHRIEHEGIGRSAIQELKFLQSLKECKGVIPIIDSYLYGEQLAIVFPFAESDLTGLCDCPKKLNLAEVKCIMKQILEALVEIHSHNLIHRDIKTANILFHQGKVFVADVGMMTQHERNKLHDPREVTLWYRAPELLLGKCNYGPEIDIWSVGCILVEMLTNQTPFPGMNEAHQMDRVFQMIGTPNETNWGEEVTTYSGWKKLRQNLYKSNQIRKTYKDWDNDALDFLEKLWNPPCSRITAEEALQHVFFSTEPLPCEASSLPKVPSVHEFEVKKRRLGNSGDHNDKRMKMDVPPPMSFNPNIILKPQIPRKPPATFSTNNSTTKFTTEYSNQPYAYMDPNQPFIPQPPSVPPQFANGSHPYPYNNNQYFNGNNSQQFNGNNNQHFNGNNNPHFNGNNNPHFNGNNNYYNNNMYNNNPNGKFKNFKYNQPNGQDNRTFLVGKRNLPSNGVSATQ